MASTLPQDDPLAAPRLTWFADVSVDVGEPLVLGDGAQGLRRVVPILGGHARGEGWTGRVLPGGHDFQLTYKSSDCTQLSADYFLQAADGTNIHVFNEGLVCPKGERAIFRPKLEAPKGNHEWMTSATFVATLELEMPGGKSSTGAPPQVEAVRIRFYRVR